MLKYNLQFVNVTLVNVTYNKVITNFDCIKYCPLVYTDTHIGLGEWQKLYSYYIGDIDSPKSLRMPVKGPLRGTPFLYKCVSNWVMGIANGLLISYQ